jgi:aminopeptidase N
MMNEAMMNFEIQPESLLNAITKFLPVENELQNAQYILGVLGNIFWRYLPLYTRENVCNSIEELLLDELEKRGSSREKAMIYNAFVNVATSSQSIGLMKSWWNDSKKIPGLTLSENDYTQLAYELAVRGADDSEIILKTQSGNIKNPDRKQRMEFVIPALSSNKEVRDQFFESLKMEINREHEPWVLEALGYLHHPVRSAHAVEYIQGSLELLEEIQKTGDIFFPTRWLGATFSGHNTKEAAEIVRRFLDSHPHYPSKLREKILQTSDPLFRASVWNKESIE